MSVSNGKIAAPVSISDIAKCIGDTTDITRSPNINRWAKYKPVRASFALGSRPSDWWKADDGWCGLSIANAKVGNTSDVSGIASKYTADKNNGWDYAAPRKGVDDSRILDFAGYNHNVDPFVGGYTMPERWAQDAGNITVTFKLTQSGESSADYLAYSDLPLSNQYLGVALIGANGTYRCTNTTTIDASGFSVEFDAKNLAEDTYEVYPFISDKQMSILDGGHFAANVYTVPNVASKTLVVVEKSIVITITCSYSTLTRLDYTINVTNNGAAAKSFITNEVRVRYSDKIWNDARESDEVFVEGQPADFTVGAGETKTLTGSVIVSSYELRNDTKFWVSLHGGNYIESKAVDQTITPSPL